MTRPRPGVDRCASAWLIRRFIDRKARFAFAPEDRVSAGAVPYDMFHEEGFGHRGDDCTFETYSAGESFTDLGCGDIHNVVNETAAEAKDVAVQIVPHGAPRRIEVDDPGCPNVPPCPAF